MGVSYSIMPISDVQSNNDFKGYLNSLEKFGNIDSGLIETNSRYPSLNEIYESLEKAQITICSENKRLDELEIKKGNEIVIHSLSITDSEVDYEDDLTLKYFKSNNNSEPIFSLTGIKSDIRILIKAIASIAKICGSYIILSPYEVYFIDKNKDYQKIWMEFNEKK
jgi:hypothetical protein